jgi:hypothetical protein
MVFSKPMPVREAGRLVKWIVLLALSAGDGDGDGDGAEQEAMRMQHSQMDARNRGAVIAFKPKVHKYGHIRSGTRIPNKAMPERSTAAVRVQSSRRNAFFAAVSALAIECSA